jgi:methyl-accepting chemotaxis protein
MDEISSQTEQNNKNAIQARQLTNETLNIVQQSVLQMEKMLKSMNEIDETSKSVAKVIKVIDEIAFQTNLLALNAAVEAARAGKYGKGFAVVAEEVRNLANRSAEAAKNTTDLIENSTKEVANGVDNAEKTAGRLAEINESVKKANDIVSEITEASGQQSMGIKEVNAGLNQVNSIVQQNSSISEETAAASTELSTQSTRMHEIMSQFRLNADDPVKGNLESETETLDVTQEIDTPNMEMLEAEIGVEKVYLEHDDKLKSINRSRR